MAKKKINIKSVISDVPSGDVNITYKNVRIAGLSESTTAVLETENTICEDNIEVDYTKPSTAITMPIYILAKGENNPTYKCTYNGAGNTILNIDLPTGITIEEVTSVILVDIENINDEDAVPIPFIYDYTGHIVMIPTVNITAIAPTANIVLIKYQLERIKYQLERK